MGGGVPVMRVRRIPGKNGTRYQRATICQKSEMPPLAKKEGCRSLDLSTCQRRRGERNVPFGGRVGAKAV